MEYKVFDGLKEINDRTVSGLAAVFGNVDAGGDRIHAGAFRKTLKERRWRIKHLWMHDPYTPPTAVIKDLREIGVDELPERVRTQYPDATGGLLVVREYLDTARGNEILTGIKAGAITEMSFAYDAVKWDIEESNDKRVRNLRELRLWDTSDVTWGMNEATVAMKAAVTYHDYGVAAEDSEWSKPNLSDFTDDRFEDLDEAEKRRIMNHYAWTANNPPEIFDDLKLPHHRAQKEGVGAAVWAGVRSAMSVLLGGMGGVDIPEGDRRGVYNHLVSHYKQFDKEPPDYKLVELAANVRAVMSLGDKFAELERVLELLQETQAEPLSKHSLEMMWRRLAILEHELELVGGN